MGHDTRGRGRLNLIITLRRFPKNLRLANVRLRAVTLHLPPMGQAGGGGKSKWSGVSEYGAGGENGLWGIRGDGPLHKKSRPVPCQVAKDGKLYEQKIKVEFDVEWIVLQL
jgi:hypothetical protein